MPPRAAETASADAAAHNFGDRGGAQSHHVEVPYPSFPKTLYGECQAYILGDLVLCSYGLRLLLDVMRCGFWMIFCASWCWDLVHVVSTWFLHGFVCQVRCEFIVFPTILRWRDQHCLVGGGVPFMASRYEEHKHTHVCIYMHEGLKQTDIVIDK